MKVLIIRFSSIGDIVLTTPVVRVIKTQRPDVEIHYCTKKSFQAIVDSNPYIHKVHVLDNNLSNLVQQLKSENFDLIIDLHNNLRTSILKLRLAKPAYTFNKLNFKKWLYINWKLKVMPPVHIVDRYLAPAIKALDVINDKKGLDYFIPAKDVITIGELPYPFNHGYVAFAIGAQHATKRLPFHKLKEALLHINHPVILLGGKEDIDTGDLLVKALESEGKTTIFNACGKYNLNGSASLVKQSLFVVTHDTGLMHIAAAFKKKIISIWGNTTPELGMYPYLSEHSIIENKNLDCRPCSKIGYPSCPKKHFRCMNELDLSVLNAY